MFGEKFKYCSECGGKCEEATKEEYTRILGPSPLIEIWSEGYVVTGNSGGAMCHDKIKASSLKEACNKLSEKDEEFKKFYSPDSMTYWGCRLYESKNVARKSFG